MAGRIDARLAELGITLPTPAAPVANYVPFVRTGDLVVISGQLPITIPSVAGYGAGLRRDVLAAPQPATSTP